MSENLLEVPGNGYHYGTSSAQSNVPMSTNSAGGFDISYDPNFYVLKQTLNTPRPLTELFRSNVSRASSGKFYVTPIPSFMSALASNLGGKSGFGKIWLRGPKILDRDEK